MMKKTWVISILLLCFNLFATAQDNLQKINSVSLLVQKFFNEKSAEKIYALTGEKFQKQLSIEIFKTLVEKQLFPLGQSQKHLYEKNTDG
ncbi:MAG TPA: hypothetical protein VM012_10830, partial [Flavitalea sp.]|nr:hypothetical protein [Flavitalea sp.]